MKTKYEAERRIERICTAIAWGIVLITIALAAWFYAWVIIR